jgi:hypothetical protein
MNFADVCFDAGFWMLILLISCCFYVSFSIEHWFELKEGTKPSWWAVPGLFLYSSLISISLTLGIYRIFMSIFS